MFRWYTCAVAIVLALMSALVYGVSDYVGGRNSRRFSPITISWVSELTMLVAFGLSIPLLVDGGPSSRVVWWSIVGGLSGSLGVLGLYAALARGNMTVVAPITGVVSAGLPVVVGLVLGERPAPLAVAGIVLAVVAVALIGGVVGATRQQISASTIMVAALVGGAFGMLFIAYSQAGQDGDLWPLLLSRLGGVPLLSIAYLVARRRGAIEPLTGGVFRPAIAIGVMVGTANGLYLLSTHSGLLSIVAVIVSLYPASTIMLAIALDHERASRSQLGGMTIAAVAVAAITIGS